MNTKYSILHISDLHKPSGQTYDSLLASLKKEKAAWKKEGMAPVKIIVVSGDLIEGTKDVNIDYKIELTNQYTEVCEFLSKLVNEFLDGDKRRIIIVPGNHDFSMPDSINSMSKSVKSQKDDYKLYSLCKETIPIRWSWQDFSFYYIVDENLYGERFSAFENFYNSFYAGIRTLPKPVDGCAYVIDLMEYNITFACFNSCYKLDHLNPMGRINSDSLSNIQNELDDYNKFGRLIVGVWHHHISGLPYENNYMDSRILNVMMNNNIKIGLFGHQHLSKVIHLYKDITSDKDMLLISSGTLYGGKAIQHAGQNRQYNIIEVEMRKKESIINIHSREDVSNGCYSYPEWGKKAIGIKSQNSYSYNIKLVPKTADSIVLDVEREVNIDKNFYKACQVLKREGLRNELNCRNFDNYLKQITEPKQVLELVGKNPIDETQYMCGLDASVKLKDAELVEYYLSEKYAKYDNSFIDKLKETARRFMPLWKKK